MSDFMFATGIENSYPLIAGGVRVDEMEKCGHYDRWREDLEAVRRLGIRFLRWGPALYRTFRGPGRYDWQWTDAVVAEMRRLEITPILDLCHFGVPDWLESFQNEDFAPFFAEYASACARRYPFVRFWTPINEPLITTLFSAKYGWWNEQLCSDHAFVRATLNVCRASRLAMSAISRELPGAVFVQSESCEFTHPSTPAQRARTEFLNERRFLPLDLIYGRTLSGAMREYLDAHGARAGELRFFSEPLPACDWILGTDYYAQNEYLLTEDDAIVPAGEIFGYHFIAKQYYHRYRVPLMHTETNMAEELGAAQWLRKQWFCARQLVDEGVSVIGFTWYSLTDQMDWDTALREDSRQVNRVGLLDLDRQMRPVGHEYVRLMSDWAEAIGSDQPELRARAA